MLKLSSINAGKISTWYNRSMKYINLIRTMMMVAIFLSVVEWSWWYLIAIPFVLLLIYYDIAVVFGQEIDYGIKKSKTWSKMIKQIDEIHQKSLEDEDGYKINQ